MIRKTLAATKAATFCIELPQADLRGMPGAIGTGFFVTPDGWFVTAAHVVTQNNRPNGQARDDLEKMYISQMVAFGQHPTGASGPVLHGLDPYNDVALLKFDFGRESKSNWLSGKEGFPHLEISTRLMEEGEPVYSFGFPLTETSLVTSTPEMAAVTTKHSARVTSAVIAAVDHPRHGPYIVHDNIIYVMDKALNYGNSGGPIVATETGKVFALCSRFQPVFFNQPHLEYSGRPMAIMAPSLYGLIPSLSNPDVVKLLGRNGILTSAD